MESTLNRHQKNLFVKIEKTSSLHIILCELFIYKQFTVNISKYTYALIEN